MTEPRTEAGREHVSAWLDIGDMEEAVLAIEAEAVAAYRAELRAKVEGLPAACHSHSGLMCEPDEFGH